jgi:hypothetical protein
MAYKRLDTLKEPIWEKQEGETAQDFRMFETYRDADPKISTAEVARRYKKSTETAGKVCHAKKWVERRDAFADHIGKLTVDELERGIPKMRKLHVDIARTMYLKALEALKSTPANKLTPQNISQMIDIGAKLERISRGEATEKIENDTHIEGEQVLIYLPDNGRD